MRKQGSAGFHNILSVFLLKRQAEKMHVGVEGEGLDEMRCSSDSRETSNTVLF